MNEFSVFVEIWGKLKKPGVKLARKFVFTLRAAAIFSGNYRLSFLSTGLVRRVKPTRNYNNNARWSRKGKTTCSGFSRVKKMTKFHHYTKEKNLLRHSNNKNN